MAISSKRRCVTRCRIKDFFTRNFRNTINVRTTSGIMSKEGRNLRMINRFHVVICRRRNLLLLPSTLYIFRLVLFFHLCQGHLILFFFKRNAFFKNVKRIVRQRRRNRSNSTSFNAIANFRMTIVRRHRTTNMMRTSTNSPIVNTFKLVIRLMMTFRCLLRLFLKSSIPTINRNGFSMLHISIFINRHGRAHDLFTNGSIRTRFRFPAIQDRLRNI